MHGYGNAHSALAARRDFIVLAPQLPRAGDLWLRYADDVREVLAEVCAGHAVDEARMYLTGFSRGGNGVFDLALTQPDLWAALWAVDPTRVPREAPARPLWLSVGEVDKWIWADDGKDHVGSARAAYGDERVYSWLLRYVR